MIRETCSSPAAGLMQAGTRSISPQQQGKEYPKCALKLSTGIKNKTAKRCKMHKISCSRAGGYQTVSFSSKGVIHYPPPTLPSSLPAAAYWKCYTRDSFTAKVLFP